MEYKRHHDDYTLPKLLQKGTNSNKNMIGVIVMIILKREEPRIISKIEALMSRLPENHLKMERINKDYSNFKAGYQGETRVDYYFSLMDQNKYDFYHGLRLYNGNTYFQIDTLIVSDYFILCDEIKNLSGTIVYDKKNNQFKKNDAVITNPFSQVKLQKIQLVDWLHNHNFQPFIVDILITMANPSTKIETPLGTPDEYWKLGYGHDLLEKIHIYEKSYKKEQFPSKERKRLKKLLLKYHTPLEIDVLKKYELSKEEILGGVECPSCHVLPMKHIYGTWICPQCLYKSKDAHKKTIQDHFLLFGPTITNKEFREFSHIQSRQISSRFLAEQNLSHTGINKGRIYYKPNYIPVEKKEA
jgi:hypothetical protein